MRELDDEAFATAREEMLRVQVEARGIKDSRLVEAMRRVPRHLFLPKEIRFKSYWDGPQTIGYGQTISQPYIVALMTNALNLTGAEKVLEIGTGCGYQTAILAEMAREVHSIEIVSALHERAKKLLRDLGYSNIHCHLGDGHFAWKDDAPYDAIIVTCAASNFPQALADQLAEGGLLCIPEGQAYSTQTLYLYRKVNADLERRELLYVRFVPMVNTRSL